MAKKQVRDTKQARLGGVKKNNRLGKSQSKTQAPDPIKLSLANAPVYQAAFTQQLIVEFKKMNLMLGDIVKMLRESNG